MCPLDEIEYHKITIIWKKADSHIARFADSSKHNKKQQQQHAQEQAHAVWGRFFNNLNNSS